MERSISIRSERNNQDHFDWLVLCRIEIFRSIFTFIAILLDVIIMIIFIEETFS